jgi:AAA+ ATPase superfamily predicted ATPase
MFSDPVVGDDFFGRQEIIDLLTKRAQALKSGYRQNVALIGHRELGKTSILRNFLYRLQDPQILSIYVEIKLQALDFFVEQFVRSLFYQYLSLKGPVDPAESLARLCQAAQAYIPKTVDRTHEILGHLKHRRSDEAYSRLFELTSVLKSETGLHCIVILDEFHRLGEFGIKNAFSDFGKRIMVQKDTMYVLSSSSFSASRKILAEKLALLFGNFERVYLEPFDFKTSFEFLERKLSPAAADENLKHFLVAFTDGHPFFLQTITSAVRELTLSRGESEVSRETVAEVFRRLLFESQGVLNQYFSKLVAPWTQMKSRGSQILILTALARGVNRLKDLSIEVNRSQREVALQIQELIEQELVIKNGVFYRFHNKIFKFWLREVYERRELSLLGARAKSEDFRSRALSTIAEYEELLRTDVTQRLVKLFSQFRNDRVEFGEKGRQLPHFTEVLTVDPAAIEGLQGPSRNVIAKGNGRCWVCKIVEEKATEKEVLSLVQDSTTADLKKIAPTRVLVALNGLDENAKLIAKNKKVLTLGLSRVNLLMDLYGREPIVCRENPQ